MGDHAVFSGRVPVAGTGAAPGGRAQPAVSPHLRGLCPGGGAGVRRGTGAVPREVAAEDRLCAGRPAGADLWRGAGLQNGDAVFLSPVQHGGHGSEQRPDGLLGGDLAWDLAESAHPGPDAPSGGPGGGLPPAAVPRWGAGGPPGGGTAVRRGGGPSAGGGGPVSALAGGPDAQAAVSLGCEHRGPGGAAGPVDHAPAGCAARCGPGPKRSGGGLLRPGRPGASAPGGRGAAAPAGGDGPVP